MNEIHIESTALVLILYFDCTHRSQIPPGSCLIVSAQLCPLDVVPRLPPRLSSYTSSPCLLLQQLSKNGKLTVQSLNVTGQLQWEHPEEGRRVNMKWQLCFARSRVQGEGSKDLAWVGKFRHRPGKTRGRGRRLAWWCTFGIPKQNHWEEGGGADDPVEFKAWWRRLIVQCEELQMDLSSLASAVWSLFNQLMSPTSAKKVTHDTGDEKTGCRYVIGVLICEVLEMAWPLRYLD